MTKGAVYPSDFGSGLIFNCLAATINIALVIWNGTTVSNLTFTPQLFNLTEIFGSGNEPTTVTDCEKWLNGYLDYGITNYNGSKIVASGRNLLDFETLLTNAGVTDKSSVNASTLVNYDFISLSRNFNG